MPMPKSAAVADVVKLRGREFQAAVELECVKRGPTSLIRCRVFFCRSNQHESDQSSHDDVPIANGELPETLMF